MTPLERDFRTEVIPTVPQDAPLVDPFPPDVIPAGRRAERAPRDASGVTVGWLVRVLSVAVIATVAFVAGQFSVRAGVVPPPPAPKAAATVITDAQMARVWPKMAHPDQATVCQSWADGTWREYITDRWVQHLHSPAGGGIDVDRAAVAEFIGRVCARGG